MEQLTTEVLVVGGGTGGTAAAIQAARRGAQTILVSEFDWLGGMLTAAGVCAPDGNELAPFQTGLWGAFLQQLWQRQPGGLDHAWVSFFTYDPAVGAAIFADWVQALPNLRWIRGQTPLGVLKSGDRLTGIRFANYTIQAQVILDGTELGDVLALADVPHRWGWEWQDQWQEPSAPVAPNDLTQQYPVQAPTWVVMLQDGGSGTILPEVPPPHLDNPAQFADAWTGYGADSFLNYGRLPGDRFMINWPQAGNDYGRNLNRLVQSDLARQAFLQEARWHAQSFARFIQAQLGRRYGLADTTFLHQPNSLGGGAYGLHPYYRESRRVIGLTIVCEQDILPLVDGAVAALPHDQTSAAYSSAIALGNYANDHHYPGWEFALHPKSIRWGGRWTGTAFAMPYGCLVPATVDGLLVCEKNISVSHIANGATRLQPVVLGVGQAAGMAAALCVELQCQPRDLPARAVQDGLLHDAQAPAAIIPLFNLPPDHPDWLAWQQYYREHPDAYPVDGCCPLKDGPPPLPLSLVSSVPSAGSEPDLMPAAIPEDASTSASFSGSFRQQGWQDYRLQLATPPLQGKTVSLVTLDPTVNQQLQTCTDHSVLSVWGRLNHAGNWLLVEKITSGSSCQ